MTIRYISFDFDGCLFHSAHDYRTPGSVIKHNSRFLDELKKENRQYSNVHLMVGSNRQSFKRDRYNMWVNKETPSCYQAIQELNDYLGTELDPILMADLCNGFRGGISFAKAINPDNRYQHGDCYFDNQKITLIYAQMQRMALKYADSEEKIIFDFYDDDPNGSILEPIRLFFKTNPHLIPKNVTLQLHKYDGKEAQAAAILPGKGIIDMNYRETVLEMARTCTDKPFGRFDGTKIDTSRLTAPIPYNASTPLLTYSYMPQTLLTESVEEKDFKALISKLATKEAELRSQKCEPAADEIKKLQLDLKALGIDHFEAGLWDNSKFRKLYGKIITKSYDVFAQHQKDNWLQYMATGTANYLFGSRHFMFNTQTETRELLENVAKNTNKPDNRLSG